MTQALIPGLFAASIVLAMAACSGPAVVENSATSVTIRHSVADTEAAAELAQRACATRHKTARLRNTANFGLTDRYGHFDCV
jgi:hypothetical protein